jgi:glycosyltransferase involved in cell wall biosynthesis
MSTLRVALCFGTYPPERNGGSDFVERLGLALVARDVEVLVLTSAGVPGLEEIVPGLVVRRLVSDWTARASLSEANAVLAAQRIQLVHVLYPDSVLREAYRLPAGLGAGQIPLVTTFWNLGLGRHSPVATRLEALALLARSKVVTSHDPGYLHVLRRAVGWAKPVRHLPVGNNLDATADPTQPALLRKQLGLSGTAQWLAYFGQLDPTRGVEDLFSALAQLRSRRDVRLMMIGSAGRPERYDDPASSRYLRTVTALPARLGVEDAVVWTDYLPDAEGARHLRAADLCVLPYRRNSIGRSALAAALEYGVPTVLAGAPNRLAPLVAGEHVHAVLPGRPDLLATAIDVLLNDPERRRELAEGALRAGRLFSWESIAATAESIYRQALGAQRS